MRKFDQILKLPPDARVKALRELSELLKKKIAENTKQSKERELDVDELTGLLDRAREELQVVEQIQTPKPREIKIEDLFRKEKKEEKSLEEVAHEQIKLTPQEEIKAEILKYKPTEELYSTFKELYAQKDQLSEKGREELYTTAGALEKQYLGAKKGDWNPEDKDWGQLSAAEKMLHYQRKQDYQR